MASLDLVHVLVLVSALLVLAGIASSLIATRFGTPLLLVFLVIGMLAGEDGFGGIQFQNYQLTYLIGSVALAVILFDGGLRTRLSSFRGALAPSVTLSTLGVVMTAGLVGLVAHLILPLSPIEALLLGAIVASTDAAAVFFLIRSGGIELKHRVGSTLEIESGTNDPAAVFLTLALVELQLAGIDTPSWSLLAALGQQASIGAVLGVGGGFLIAALLNRVNLPGGLHPPFVVASAICLFGLAAVSGGSGFLAVYLAGLVLGNSRTRGLPSIGAFHDAATWLCQIAMFILLGLLVTPSRLLEYALPGLAVALFLIFVARPVAVALCLWPFRFPWRERAFVAWVGLRGAVSIFLSAIPVLVGLPDAELYFNVAFFVVLVSLLLQGWSINAAARRLDVVLARTTPRVHRVELDLPGQLDQEMVGYPVQENSPAVERGAVPRWARPLIVIRDDEILDPRDAGPLQADDYAYFLVPPARIPRLDRLFAAAPATAPAVSSRFIFNGNVPLGALAELYGFPVDEQQWGRSIADLFDERFEEAPDIGDRLTFGTTVLVVRRLDGDSVGSVELQFGEDEEPGAPVRPGREPGPGIAGSAARRIRAWLRSRSRRGQRR